MKYDIYKIGGILIKDKKLLVTRSKNKEFFIAPGGKVEEGESPEDALIRELLEEVSIVVEKDQLKKVGTFFAPAAGNESSMLKMDVFIVESWKGKIIPSREVEEVRWINSNFSKEMKVGSIFEHEVIPKLKSLKVIE